MKAVEYQKATDFLEEVCSQVSGPKRRAYAGTDPDVDVLKNFKRQADFEGKSAFEILRTFLNKHMVSINNAIEMRPDRPVDNSEGMLMRLVDVINYSRLLFGLLAEEQLVPEFEEYLVQEIALAYTEPVPEPIDALKRGDGRFVA